MSVLMFCLLALGQPIPEPVEEVPASRATATAAPVEPTPQPAVPAPVAAPAALPVLPAKPSPVDPAVPLEPVEPEPPALAPVDDEVNPVKPAQPEHTAPPSVPAETASRAGGDEAKNNADESWLLPIPKQNTGNVLAILAAALAAWALGLASRRPLRVLRPGPLRTVLGLAVVGSRMVLVVCGLALVVQFLPEAWLAVVPWVVLGAGVATGWSLRDALPDVIAWLQLQGEGSIRAGHWLEGENFAGRVEHIGLRATRLVDPSGNRIAVPNRTLTAKAILTSAANHYVCRVQLHLPHVEPNRARRAIHRAASLSPWVAPDSGVQLAADGREPGRWTVSAHLLDGCYANRFRGGLHERVMELLTEP